MAMQFAQANRALPPDMLNAVIEQGRIEAALRQAQQARQAGNFSAAAQFGKEVPAGAWQNLGGAITGAAPAAATGSGALASAAPVTDIATGAVMSPTVAGGAGGTLASTAGTTAGGTAAGGIGSSLAALGPMGWAALAALALGASSMFE